jgi:dephospho-CoA kinase
MTKVVGLTGGIATGKSTVSKMFSESLIPVIDTDTIARDLLNKDTECYQEVVGYFGEEILFLNHEIDRKKLGKIIFHDEEKRQKLNDIVHPRVINIVLSEIEKHKGLGTKILVVDVPLLYESGFDQYMDDVIVVYTNKEMQKERLMSRDNINSDYADKKMNAQMSLEEKVKQADYVIDNSKSILETKKAFNKIVEELEVK